MTWVRRDAEPWWMHSASHHGSMPTGMGYYADPYYETRAASHIIAGPTLTEAAADLQRAIDMLDTRWVTPQTLSPLRPRAPLMASPYEDIDPFPTPRRDRSHDVPLPTKPTRDQKYGKRWLYRHFNP